MFYFDRSLDFINLMTYDLHGIWDRKTGHHSQLKGHKTDSHNFLNSVSDSYSDYKKVHKKYKHVAIIMMF